MEQLALDEITPLEFDIQAKRMFMTDDRTRKRINNIMASQMIIPRLEAENKRRQQERSKDVAEN